MEEENETFIEKIEDIKTRIKVAIEGQQKRRENNDKTFIALEDYKTAFANSVDVSKPHYQATAIIRFQILLLELLEQGVIDLSKPWQFEIIERDVKDFAKLAIEDLFIWFQHLLNLQKVEFTKLKYSIKKVNSRKAFSIDREVVKIDFSLLKRYTDEHQTHPDIIFARNDYLDEFRRFKKGSSHKMESLIEEPYDHFKVSTCQQNINYKLEIGGKLSHEESLRFLLWNIFLQNNEDLGFNTCEFREGQLPIIINALSRNDTIGLLPTGAGKSVCYQLSAILQPAISFVVCPIKSLMYDQKNDLESVYFSRTNHITSADDEETKERMQKEFGEGKYLFIFISPERFQIQSFRDYMRQVNENFTIGYAVVDEVHCLSEWGHDFRTSYLNLAKTIRKHCSDFTFIGLTATASLNVLKDTQIEFDVADENVKTLVDYTRRELDFQVIDCTDKNTETVLYEQVESQLKESGGLWVCKEKPDETRCRIIFTPHVNGWKGCYELSQKLARKYTEDIRFFSGSKPNKWLNSINFEDYKKKTQEDFKKNKFSTLAATKSFGMGLNKPNIHYTFHYGIPQSIEALYQEAGRAGRNKVKFGEESNQEKAKCFVLLSRSMDEQILEELWTLQTPLSKVQKLKEKTSGDVNTNLFLFLKDLDPIPKEAKIINDLYEKFAKPNAKKVLVKGIELNCSKAKTEKAIYRLNQLGIVEDWTVEDWAVGKKIGGSFKVDFANFSKESIRTSLLNTIKKYESDFSFESLEMENRKTYEKILNAPPEYTDTHQNILLLLQWSYDHFIYNRRQSLKNIYELCCDVVGGRITKEELRTRIENYFKVSTSTTLLQHIADNPKEYGRWFEVFYNAEGNSRFITTEEQKSLRDGLGRLLESYGGNAGLNLISGLLRLLLNDYDNAYGRDRFESALRRIQNYEKDEIDFIIEEILKIGNNMNNKNRPFLAKSLHRFFDKEEFLVRVHETLNDSYSLTILLRQKEGRLKKVKEALHGRLEEI